MIQKTAKILWVLVFVVIFFSVIYTSYKTLVQKDFIIFEQEEVSI